MRHRTRLLLASDLDHTMVQNEDTAHRHLLAFDRAWQSHCASDSLLVFSTGRSPELFKQLWQEAPLLTPDILICSVGTEVFYNTRAVSTKLPAALFPYPIPSATSHPGAAPSAARTHPAPAGAQPATGGGGAAAAGGGTAAEAGDMQAAAFVPEPAWEAFLDQGWDRAKAQALVAQHFPQLTPQAASEQRPHKASYSLDPTALPGGATEAAQLMARLQAVLKEEHSIRAKVVYSGGRDVDVLSEAAGKGRALSFVLQRLKEAGCEPANVQVAGDSGNDVELFQVPGVKGCVVANAHPELRAFAEAEVAKGQADHICQATEQCAGAILQALRHFGLMRSPASCDPAPPPHGSPAAPHQPQQQQWLQMGSEACAREFAWQIGCSLAAALHGLGNAPGPQLSHPLLRLLVTNDCSLTLHPPHEAGQPSQPPPPPSAAAAEVQQDLEPVAVVAAAEASQVHGTWIDELTVERVPVPPAPAVAQGGDEAAAAEGTATVALAAWRLSFKVYSLGAQGRREGPVYEVDAHAQLQRQPVPHGMLAQRIRVFGPCGQPPLPRITRGLAHA